MLKFILFNKQCVPRHWAVRDECCVSDTYVIWLKFINTH